MVRRNNASRREKEVIMIRLFGIFTLVAGVAGCVAVQPNDYGNSYYGPGYYVPGTAIGVASGATAGAGPS
jgi:hypothetical protein